MANRYPDNPDRAPDDGALTLTTLGAVRLEYVRPGSGHPPEPALSPGKAQALVAYLHSSPNRTASRDSLTDLFWSDAGPEEARQSLRQLVYRIRAELGRESIASIDNKLVLNALIVSDRDRFLAAVRAGRAAEAVDTYGGEFFPDFAAPGAAGFEQWADLERDQLRAAFLRAAESAVRHALDQPAHREAVRLASRARQLCPHAQLAWRLLIEAQLATGNQPAALLEADVLRSQLQRDDADPEPATVRLLERVRSKGARAPTETEPAPPFLRAELVGREREFAALLAGWEQARTRSARHIHIEGSPGLGKSRLLEELARRLQSIRSVLVQVRAIPGERHRDLAFAGDLIHSLGQLPGVAGTSPEALRELSLLAPALSSFIPGTAEPRRQPASAAVQILALVELVNTVSTEAPIALLLDDLHWADDASLSMVDGLVQRLGNASVLVVTTSRGGGRAMPDGATSARMSLKPLDPSAVQGLLSSLGANLSDPAIPRLASTLHVASGGNPLLVLELLQLAQQRGLLELGQTGWRWDDPESTLVALAQEDPLLHRVRAASEAGRRAMIHLAVAEAPLSEVALIELAGVSRQDLDSIEGLGLLARAGEAVRPAHDEVAAAARRMASGEELASAHLAIGGWIARELAVDRAAFPRAAWHFREAAALPQLGELYRSRVALARQGREKLSLDQLATTALGAESSNRDRQELVRTLGPMVRLGYRQPVWMMAATVVLALLVGSAFWPRSGNPPRSPDALALLATGDPDKGELVRIHGIPIDVARFDGPDSVRLTEGKVLFTLPEGSRVYYTMAMNDLGELAYDEVTRDSGGIDLMLLDQTGNHRRLTKHAGDDHGPSWSPDGRLLAFATARWTPRGNDDSDIALMDPSTGQVTQLTRGTEYDGGPKWSPDGTTIAFLRSHGSVGHYQACLITMDRRELRCAPDPRGVGLIPLAWESPVVLLLSLGQQIAHGRVARWDIIGDSVVTVEPLPEGLVLRDPVGGYALVVSRGERLWTLTSPGRSTGHLRLPIERGPGRFGWYSTLGANSYLSLLSIDAGNGPAQVGITHQLRAVGTNPVGNRVPVSQFGLRWWVEDSTMAIVDPRSGVMTPLREGRARIFVSAAGWRQTSSEIAIKSPEFEPAFREDWQMGALTRWQQYGDPTPDILVGPGGIRGLFNGGDQTFSSGVYSLRAVAGESFGLSAMVSTPVSETKWQNLHLNFVRDPSPATSGLSGYHACGFRIPLSEGRGNSQLLSVGAVIPDNGVLPVGDALAGKWYEVQLQVFPDRTCGVAIDGRPVFRGRTAVEPGGDWHVQIDGQSVGTRMLVGPLEAWTGIRPGIDWNGVGQK